MHTQAKKVDDAKSERFYKMAKYVKANIDKPTDPHVHKFTQIDNLRHDLIEVPEEFQDLSIADIEQEVKDGGFGRRKPSAMKRSLRA